MWWFCGGSITPHWDIFLWMIFTDLQEHFKHLSSCFYTPRLTARNVNASGTDKDEGVIFQLQHKTKHSGRPSERVFHVSVNLWWSSSSLSPRRQELIHCLLVSDSPLTPIVSRSASLQSVPSDLQSLTGLLQSPPALWVFRVALLLKRRLKVKFKVICPRSVSRDFKTALNWVLN